MLYLIRCALLFSLGLFISGSLPAEGIAVSGKEVYAVDGIVLKKVDVSDPFSMTLVSSENSFQQFRASISEKYLQITGKNSSGVYNFDTKTLAVISPTQRTSSISSGSSGLKPSGTLLFALLFISQVAGL